MSLRFALSNLTKSEARQTVARWLIVLCAAGYLFTLSVMFATGGGLRRWFGALLVWALIFYLPLRILLETFQTLGPRLRRNLVSQVAGLPSRYANRASVELIVDGLFEREIVMPRIAKPVQTAKAKEGAVAVLLRVGQGDVVHFREAVVRCLATVDRWVAEIAEWSARAVPDNIQARWADLRALVSLTAQTKTLIAAYRDRSSESFAIPRLDGGSVGRYLDACLDYCDDLALKVDAQPWTEPPLGLMITPEVGEEMRRAWVRFCETASPALEAREAFVNVLLPQI